MSFLVVPEIVGLFQVPFVRESVTLITPLSVVAETIPPEITPLLVNVPPKVVVPEIVLENKTELETVDAVRFTVLSPETVCVPTEIKPGFVASAVCITRDVPVELAPFADLVKLFMVPIEVKPLPVPQEPQVPLSKRQLPTLVPFGTKPCLVVEKLLVVISLVCKVASVVGLFTCATATELNNKNKIVPSFIYCSVVMSTPVVAEAAQIPLIAPV